MPRFVALLRGINVGKAKRIPMAELREMLTSLGYTGVRTLLNSGNVVFESPGRLTTSHAKRIRTGITDAFKLDVPVIVKSAEEMAVIESGNGLAGIVTNPSRLLVAFTGDSGALRDLAALSPLVKPPERMLLGKEALYLWLPEGILESQAAEALLGKLGKGVTTRNWATVVKIMELLQD
ncbi:MAG: hypothetical protein FD129_473 [bacterium]|nr:MAG: hypothetical protein FD129_473 [bacterium]